MHNFRDVKAGNVHVMVHTVEKMTFLFDYSYRSRAAAV